MSGWRSLEQHLLDHLPLLKQIEFCVHSVGADHRRKFDHWTKNEVISIFRSRHFMTRFTIPYAFDRLEHASNDFVDYHSNYRQSNTILSFPSIVMITFYSSDQLNLALFTFIQQTCPFLRHIRFEGDCDLNDELIQNTEVTLPMVTELCLRDVVSSIDSLILCRVLSLIPNLQYLTAQRHHLALIDNMNNNVNVLKHIIKITIVE